jgi:hypothetical protein
MDELLRAVDACARARATVERVRADRARREERRLVRYRLENTCRPSAVRRLPSAR